MLIFENLNPVTITFYYFACVFVSMFTMNPYLHLIAFAGGIIQFGLMKSSGSFKSHILYWITGIILILVRPLFSHNGATVLFVLNDNPVTKESFIYGANAALMIVGVIYLFRIYSDIMTSDKLLYLFGGFSQKTALVLSMGLRFIPMLREQKRLTGMAQKAIGINRDDNMIDRIKAQLNEFWATVGWGLEKGIITADSMTARGYGSTKRSRYRLFRFRKSDLVILIITAFLTAPVVYAMILGEYDVSFYPVYRACIPQAAGIIGYVCYGIILFMPSFIRISENIRWKYLISKT